MKMLSPELIAALNAQITTEYANCAVYWSAERAMRDQSLCGTAQYLHEGASEERHHAKKLANYMIERGERPAPGAEGPVPAFYDMRPVELFQAVAQLEATTTERIDNLYGMAVDSEDNSLAEFLRWFVKEQHQSEAEIAMILDWWRMVDDEGAGTLMVDKKLKRLAKK